MDQGELCLILQSEIREWLDNECKEAMHEVRHATSNEHLWGAKYRLEAAESFATRMAEQVGKGIMAKASLDKA